MANGSKRSPSLYSVHPGVAYARAIVQNLPEKTGKTMAQWVRLVQEEAPASHKERRAWLKELHGLGGTTAWMIADQAEGKGAEDMDPKAYLAAAVAYVEAMYTGSKAGLRPIHDALIELGLSLGHDVKICPCKTMVPLYRNHVFAEIKPAARTRLDLGLALAKAEGSLPSRLVDTGGSAKKDRITHRIPLSAPEDIDEEVRHWLIIAYDLDG